MTRLPRSFYAASACMGFAYANFAVAMPLYAVALGRSASFAGTVLALETAALAAGALAASSLLQRSGSARLLSLGLVLIGLGHLLFLVPAGVPPLLPGAAAHGVGLGLFWVASQAMLGRRSGVTGSERSFVHHYAAYTLGGLAGAAVTGGVASLARLALEGAGAVRPAFGLGLAAALVGVAAWRPAGATETQRRERVRLSVGLPFRGLALQLPDLLLVAGVGLVLPLAPYMLATRFGLSPASVGLVVAGVAASKVAGSYAAGGLVRSFGSRKAIPVMLAAASLLAFLLALADTAGLFVAGLLGTALAATGAWPVIVDASLARVPPAERGVVAVTWNAREYGLIAAVTALAGWLLAAHGSPGLLVALAASLLAASAAVSGAVYRRPVHTPQPAPARA